MTPQQIFGLTFISVSAPLIISFLIFLAYRFPMVKSKGKPEYKKYMVFEYYPYDVCGGLEDCEESFNDKESAIKYCRTADKSYYYEILDRISGIEIDWKLEPVKHVDPREEMLQGNREKAFKLMEQGK